MANGDDELSKIWEMLEGLVKRRNDDELRSSYPMLGLLIERHNPYGPRDRVEFPTLTTDEHIGTAWWLREVVATNPISGCNDKMTDLEENLCTTLMFPWNRDPLHGGDLGGKQDTYQVCKVVLVPYVYHRDRDGCPMRAYMGLCFIGSGGHIVGPNCPPPDEPGTTIKDRGGNHVPYEAPDARPQPPSEVPTRSQEE